MIVPLFFTATAYRSEEFLGSLSHIAHINASPTVAAHTFQPQWQPRMQFLSKNFSMAVTLSVRSSRLLCCKIFVLKYFHRTSTLRKFFNTKIFPTKISYNENFPIYGILVCALYLGAKDTTQSLWEMVKSCITVGPISLMANVWSCIYIVPVDYLSGLAL